MFVRCYVIYDGVFSPIYVVFYYMYRFANKVFFHSFASFLGRNPPCFVVLGVNSGNVCVAHVSSSVVDISLVGISSVSHADFHCGVRVVRLRLVGL